MRPRTCERSPSAPARFATTCKFLLRASEEEYVYFLEIRGRHVALRAAPIDVSHIIRDVLIDRLPSLVLTSATLSIGGSFGYVRARLGIGEALEVRVASEFDYRTQALVYLPRKMPDPRTREYAAAFAEEAAQLLTASEGRAFLLFTSYAALRDAHARLSTRLPYPMFVQGTMPRGVLIEQFRRTPNAVLFGTSSFWQGVDVMGEALSCVIIDRIPFASPGDPVVAARIEALQRRGIDAFAGFQVPLAILTLLQGVGRLIRHRQDRGVIALLDPRLQSMGYGRRFLNALAARARDAAPRRRREVLRRNGRGASPSVLPRHDASPDDARAIGSSEMDGSESRPYHTRRHGRRLPSHPAVAWLVAATLLLAHLLTLGRYGIFRDEFYYVANGAIWRGATSTIRRWSPPSRGSSSTRSAPRCTHCARRCCSRWQPCSRSWPASSGAWAEAGWRSRSRGWPSR